MKQIISYSFGTLAIINLICGLIVLFNQPLETAVKNDTLFAALFLTGCTFCAFFLYAERMINGTIDMAKKS